MIIFQLPKPFKFDLSIISIWLYFAAFVFTPYIFTHSYIQPWYLVFSSFLLLFFLPRIFSSKCIPKTIAFYAFISGFFIFTFPTFSQIAVALTIVTTWTLLSFFFKEGGLKFLSLVIKSTRIALFIQILTSLIQLFFYRNFFLPSSLHGVQDVVIASGRGPIGLTPEPTHNALHLFFMAATIYFINKNFLELFVWLGAVILLTLSSSLILILSFSFLMSVLLYFPFYLARFRPYLRPKSILLFITILSTLSLVIYFLSFVSVSSRFMSLFSIITSSFNNSDWLTLLTSSDGSSCARIFGFFESLKLILTHLLIPHGYSMNEWLNVSNSSDVCLSSGNTISELIPSGYLSQLYYYGFLLFPLIFSWLRFLLSNVLLKKTGFIMVFMFLTVWLTPFSQYYLSDPYIIIAMFISVKVFSISLLQSPINPPFSHESNFYIDS